MNPPACSIAITTIGAAATATSTAAAPGSSGKAAAGSSAAAGGGASASSSGAPALVHQWRAHAGQVLTLAARGALESGGDAAASATGDAALAGPLLASAGSDDCICLWATGSLPAEAPALLLRIPVASRATALAWLQQQQHGEGVGSGSSSPFLLVGLQDGTACCYVVHPATGEALAAPVPTGTHGASGSFASAIKLWVPPHAVLHAHAANGMGAPVTSICSTPAPAASGSEAGVCVVATGGEDCTVRTTRVKPVLLPVPSLTVVAAAASTSAGEAAATVPAARVGDYVTAVCAVSPPVAAAAASAAGSAASAAAAAAAAPPATAAATRLWFGCMDGKVRVAGL